jgi:DNA repair exonuclease SbcCD nuclease subunit
MASKSPTLRAELSGLKLVHSSDLHLGDEETTRLSGGNETLMLERVLAAAEAVTADALLLVGDVFENNRVARGLVARVGKLLTGAGLPVIVLPGNHDPLVAGGVWRQRALHTPGNVHVLGVTHGRAVMLRELGLEIWGNPHFHYDDMTPLARPRRRTTPFQVTLAHGHYDRVPDRRRNPRPAWLIGAAEIEATGADYVALGHWNRAVRVGGGKVPAHYSGAPELASSVNVITLRPGRPAAVARRALPALK